MYLDTLYFSLFFFSSRRRHTRCGRDWSSDVCSSDLLAQGAKPFAGRTGPMELNIPAIEGIGGSALYLVDRYGGYTIYDVDFVPVGDEHVPGVGLARIDHLTYHVYRRRMDSSPKFYEDF